MQNPEDSVVYSVLEAALALRIGETKMKELIAANQVRTIRGGRRVLVPKAALLEFIEAK